MKPPIPNSVSLYYGWASQSNSSVYAGCDPIHPSQTVGTTKHRARPQRTAGQLDRQSQTKQRLTETTPDNKQSGKTDANIAHICHSMASPSGSHGTVVNSAAYVMRGVGGGRIVVYCQTVSHPGRDRVG